MPQSPYNPTPHSRPPKGKRRRCHGSCKTDAELPSSETELLTTVPFDFSLFGMDNEPSGFVPEEIVNINDVQTNVHYDGPPFLPSNVLQLEEEDFDKYLDTNRNALERLSASGLQPLDFLSAETPKFSEFGDMDTFGNSDFGVYGLGESYEFDLIGYGKDLNFDSTPSTESELFDFNYLNIAPGELCGSRRQTEIGYRRSLASRKSRSSVVLTLLQHSIEERHSGGQQKLLTKQGTPVCGESCFFVDTKFKTSSHSLVMSSLCSLNQFTIGVSDQKYHSRTAVNKQSMFFKGKVKGPDWRKPRMTKKEKQMKDKKEQETKSQNSM